MFFWVIKTSADRLNIKTPSYQHRNPHYQDKTASYLYNENHYTCKDGLYMETEPWLLLQWLWIHVSVICMCFQFTYDARQSDGYVRFVQLSVSRLWTRHSTMELNTIASYALPTRTKWWVSLWPQWVNMNCISHFTTKETPIIISCAHYIEMPTYLFKHRWWQYHLWFSEQTSWDICCST